jgi:hypothetical protein
LIRDIRPRCALAAAAHVAMMIDVVAIKFKNCRASISFRSTHKPQRSISMSRVRKRRLDPA